MAFFALQRASGYSRRFPLAFFPGHPFPAREEAGKTFPCPCYSDIFDFVFIRVIACHNYLNGP